MKKKRVGIVAGLNLGVGMFFATKSQLNAQSTPLIVVCMIVMHVRDALYNVPCMTVPIHM